jgi:hypothetical protein
VIAAALAQGLERLTIPVFRSVTSERYSPTPSAMRNRELTGSQQLVAFGW